MWRKLALFLSLTLTTPCVLSAQTSQGKPLTDAEKQQIIAQLMELRDLKLITLPQYDAETAKLQAAVEAQKAAGREAVENEREATRAAQIERDAYKERAAFLESALKAKSQKRSFGCWIKKIFSAGISGCR